MQLKAYGRILCHANGLSSNGCTVLLKTVLQAYLISCWAANSFELHAIRELRFNKREILKYCVRCERCAHTLYTSLSEMKFYPSIQTILLRFVQLSRYFASAVLNCITVNLFVFVWRKKFIFKSASPGARKKRIYVSGWRRQCRLFFSLRSYTLSLSLSLFLMNEQPKKGT